MLKLKLAFVILSIAAYAASLPTVACYNGVNGKEPLYGYHLLLFGWVELFGAGYAWLANPLLFVTLPLMFAAATHRLALCTGAFAFMLALSFLPFSLLSQQFSLLTQQTRNGMAANHYLGPSYGMWLASTAFALAGCVVRKSRGKWPVAG